MNHKSIIESINKHKTQPNLRFALKEKVEGFTSHLFYTLFDIDTPVDENFNLLEKEFDQLVKLACWEVDNPCKKL